MDKIMKTAKNTYEQIRCHYCFTELQVEKENSIKRCPACNGAFIRKVKTRYKRAELETTGAGTRSPSKSKKISARNRVKIKQRFSAKRLALMAVFVALSYAVSWLEIPLFPAVPFLRLDFGNVFILLISFLLGPVEGVIVCVLKEGLRALGSSSGGVGEIANILVTSSYILLPSIVYRFRKGIKSVGLTLFCACFIGTGVALLANRCIIFPLYMGEGAASVFADVFWYVAAFNLIKTAAVGILTMLLYKRLSNFLKKMKI